MGWGAPSSAPGGPLDSRGIFITLVPMTSFLCWLLPLAPAPQCGPRLCQPPIPP